MNKAKQEAYLNKLIRWQGAIMTRKERINIILKKGAFWEVMEEPAVKWNRRKFNNMDTKEQAEYMKRHETVVEKDYLIFDNVYYIITKTEKNYVWDL